MQHCHSPARKPKFGARFTLTADTWKSASMKRSKAWSIPTPQRITSSEIIYRTPSLVAGPHTIKLRVTGLKNPSSTGTHFIVDGANIVTPTPTPTATANPCTTLDCYVNEMPLYAQRNAAFPNNGDDSCAPTTGAMMIQSQLDKPGVRVATEAGLRTISSGSLLHGESFG